MIWNTTRFDVFMLSRFIDCSCREEFFSLTPQDSENRSLESEVYGSSKSQSSSVAIQSLSRLTDWEDRKEKLKKTWSSSGERKMGNVWQRCGDGWKQWASFRFNISKIFHLCHIGTQTNREKYVVQTHNAGDNWSVSMLSSEIPIMEWKKHFSTLLFSLQKH